MIKRKNEYYKVIFMETNFSYSYFVNGDLYKDLLAIKIILSDSMRLKCQKNC